MTERVEVVGNMHMHTPYSDGEAWHEEIAEAAIAAGLDFVIVTDHNIHVAGVEGYYQNENGRVLLLVGEEIHNVRRVPQASHLLVYGTEKELVQHAANPQALIDAVKEAGGLCFLAHPFERDLPIFNEPNLGWHDWDIDGFSGLEIWNYMTCFKNRLGDELDKLPWQKKRLGQLVALRVALNPTKYVDGPEQATLDLWDRLLAEGKRVTAVGNSDAHGTPMSLGPIKRIIYPYQFLFQAVNTHLLLEKPLSGNLQLDKQLIYHALSKGCSWVGYDMAHSTKGFRFTGQGVNKGRMGDTIQMDTAATLQAVAPAKCHMRLIHHGNVVAEDEHATNLAYYPVESGAYRVECYIQYEGKPRGWIFSNPIYVM